MGERDDARREIERKRERMTELAREVSRRATPQYAKERAREMARERMMRARVRAVESTWFGPLLGAGIGVLVGKALQTRARERDGGAAWRSEWPRDYASRRPSSPYRWAGMEDEPLWGEGEVVERGASPAWGDERETRERGAGADETSGMAEKATELKERARAATEHARERVQEASSGVRERVQGTASRMRERIPDRETIRESTHEDTGLWALGALALGALFGFALPVSQREREALEPARRKARELGHELEERAFAKGSEALDQAQARLEGSGQQDEGTSPSSGGAAADEDASPPLH